MSTYKWSIPSGKAITGLTYIKDTDNNISDTINDLVEFVNGEGNHEGQGLTYDLVDKASAQTITGVKTFSQNIVGNVTGDVTGNVSGNAGTATKLATPRTVGLIGDVTGSASFDGSANVNITTTVGNNSHTHTSSNISDLIENVQDIVGGMVSSNTESGVVVTYDDSAGKLNFNVNDPTITLSGDLSGSATMSNLGNVNISASVANDSHTHDGRYYTESEVNSLLAGKQASGSYVTTTSSQSLHSTDALRISGQTLLLYKGNGTYESVTVPDNSIGMSQSWQNMTSSRSANTLYTNNTGKTISIFTRVQISNTTSDTYLEVDGVMTSFSEGPGSGNYTYGLNTIVPNGSTYRLVTPFTLQYWSELR